MSIEAMNWALEQPVNGTKKVVLIGISSHADKFGTNAWPSVATLAGYAYVSTRAVQQAIAELETEGYLFREFNEGGSRKLPDHLRPNLYTLHLEVKPDARPVPEKKPRSEPAPLPSAPPLQPASPPAPGAASFTPSPAASFTPPGEASFTQTVLDEPSLEPSHLPEAPAGPLAAAVEPVITQAAQAPAPADKPQAAGPAIDAAVPPEKPLSAFRLRLAQAKEEREATKARKAQEVAAAKAAAKEAQKLAQLQLRNDTWAAFDAAYEARYRTTLLRNVNTRSLMASLVERLGAEAPQVAAFYVQRVDEPFVASKCHPLNLLLSGAEGYRTQWVTNKTPARPQAAPHKYAGAVAAIWSDDNNSADDARTVNA